MDWKRDGRTGGRKVRWMYGWMCRCMDVRVDVCTKNARRMHTRTSLFVHTVTRVDF